MIMSNNLAIMYQSLFDLVKKSGESGEVLKIELKRVYKHINMYFVIYFSASERASVRVCMRARMYVCLCVRTHVCACA